MTGREGEGREKKEAQSRNRWMRSGPIVHVTRGVYILGIARLRIAGEAAVEPRWPIPRVATHDDSFLGEGRGGVAVRSARGGGEAFIVVPQLIG